MENKWTVLIKTEEGNTDITFEIVRQEDSKNHHGIYAFPYGDLEKCKEHLAFIKIKEGTAVKEFSEMRLVVGKQREEK